MFTDAGLTWEADPRRAELACSGRAWPLGGTSTERAQAEPSPAPLNQEGLERDGPEAYRRVSGRLA